MTADAAHKHGHDAAPSQPASSPALDASFLVQMPLAFVGSLLRRQAPSPSQAAAASAHNAEPTDNVPRATAPQQELMTATYDTGFASPTPSRPVSSGSSAATDDIIKKRAPRAKTTYTFARPARPVDPRSKLHIRPKTLLQIHQVIPSQRAKPIYEVIPFSLLTARSTRRLAQTFNTRGRLCPNDLLVVKAKAYGNKADETDPDDEWGSNDVIGVICPGKSEKEAAEICMDDGTSRWEVTNLANGGFELNTTDDHGLTLRARWVLKIVHSRRVSGMSVPSQLSPTFPPGQEDKRYSFSTIRPGSRRHPIIANMSRKGIEVCDSYSMPSATSPPTPGLPSYPQSPALTPTNTDMTSFMDNPKDQLPVQTDDALRRFIIVSGIWVALQNYQSTHQQPTPSLEQTATFRPPNHRAVSMTFLDTPRSTSPASTFEEKRRTIPKIFRTGKERIPRSTSFTEPSPDSSVATPNASPVRKTRSRRANSTGNTGLYSMTGSMRKRHAVAFEDQTLVESEEERQIKRSVEILRIKELSIPSVIERPSLESPQLEPYTAPAIPSPAVIPPSSDGPTTPAPVPSLALLSAPFLSPPPTDSERARKTQSAFNPVDTAGLWDSGVTNRPGMKSRPTSMSVINDKRRKEEKKRERSKSKDDRAYDNDKGCPTKKHDWNRFKNGLKGLFKREKA